MADPEHVTKLPPRLTIPEQVKIQGADLRLTPNQMRALKAETGRTLDELMGETADEADRLQAIAWLELRRQGYEVRWEDVGDVAVEIGEAPVDPTSAAP